VSENKLTEAKIMTVQVVPYQRKWKEFIVFMDEKSYDWAWPSQDWDDISNYLVRILWVDNNPTGFSAFQFTARSQILISKLTVLPMYKEGSGVGVLLHDIILTAQRRNIAELVIRIWEHDAFRIKEVTKLGFVGSGLGPKFPDGSDSFEFTRQVHYGR
jgi:hypothetical protein